MTQAITLWKIELLQVAGSNSVLEQESQRDRCGMTSSNNSEKNLHQSKHSERKLFQTGSVKHKPATARPHSRGSRCQEVDNAINNFPKSQQDSYQQNLE